MKNPIDIITGEITHYRADGTILITAKYDDLHTLMQREYKNVQIQMIDSRPLSDKQRKCCYSMLGAISDWMGEERTYTKDLMKLEFMTSELEQIGDRIFSLSNAPMSLVAAFQRYLAAFIVRNEIPTKRPMIEYVDDINDFIYACALSKKCVICGRPAELHHCEGSRIGMGGDRTEIIHEGLEVLPLCREHHTIIHAKPETEFLDLYHIEKGIIADKEICRVYGLKKKKVQST